MPISGEELASVLVPCAALAIPVMAIFTSHQRKMAEIKARMGTAPNVSSVLNEVKQELQALRREVSDLRDTTTTFDMSFDAAISRLEKRVDRVEGTAMVGDAAPPLRTMLNNSVPRTDDEQIILGKKG